MTFSIRDFMEKIKELKIWNKTLTGDRHHSVTVVNILKRRVQKLLSEIRKAMEKKTGVKWYNFADIKPPTGMVVLFEDFHSHMAVGIFNGIYKNNSDHMKYSYSGDSFNCASPCKRWSFLDDERFYYIDCKTGNYERDICNDIYEINPANNHFIPRASILSEMRMERAKR